MAATEEAHTEMATASSEEGRVHEGKGIPHDRHELSL